MSRSDKQKMWRIAGLYSTFGLIVTLGFALFVVGGRWLDGYAGTAPWGMGGGVCLGGLLFVRELQRVVRMSRKYLRPEGAPEVLLEEEPDPAAAVGIQPSGDDPLSGLAAQGKEKQRELLS